MDDDDDDDGRHDNDDADAHYHQHHCYHEAAFVEAVAAEPLCYYVGWDFEVQQAYRSVNPDKKKREYTNDLHVEGHDMDPVIARWADPQGEVWEAEVPEFTIGDWRASTDANN